MSKYLKLVVPLSMVPSGEVVTKRNGEKPYTVAREIKIFGENPAVIKACEGVVYLSDGTQTYTAVKDSTEVVWQAHFAQVAKIIEPPR